MKRSPEVIAKKAHIVNRRTVLGAIGGGVVAAALGDRLWPLIRDSQDPNSPGFLRSSSFGSALQTAGGVFGTGGPRAFQFAVKVQF